MPESSLRVVINVMKSGIHCVDVMNAKSQVIGILSQTDILRFLVSKPDILDAFSQYTLEQLSLHQSPAIYAYEDEILHAALGKMRENSVSSIAIVSRSGNLIGNISMADVKYIFKQGKLALLWKSCLAFVRRILSEDGIERGKDRYPYFDATLSTSLSLVIRKLLATKTHRIWIVSKEDDHHLMGVVSLTDILKALCPSESV